MADQNLLPADQQPALPRWQSQDSIWVDWEDDTGQVTTVPGRVVKYGNGRNASKILVSFDEEQTQSWMFANDPAITPRQDTDKDKDKDKDKDQDQNKNKDNNHPQPPIVMAKDKDDDKDDDKDKDRDSDNVIVSVIAGVCVYTGCEWQRMPCDVRCVTCEKPLHKFHNKCGDDICMGCLELRPSKRGTGRRRKAEQKTVEQQHAQQQERIEGQNIHQRSVTQRNIEVQAMEADNTRSLQEKRAKVQKKILQMLQQRQGKYISLLLIYDIVRLADEQAALAQPRAIDDSDVCGMCLVNAVIIDTKFMGLYL